MGRGLLDDAVKSTLCIAAQERYEVFCAMPLVPLGQLYGGKICAALDRQHPRDLFDINLLLENEGFTEEIKSGFIYGVLSSNRPTIEILDPNFLDQRAVIESQFRGMSSLEFTYEEYEATRIRLIETIHAGLNETDKLYLLNFNSLEPDWSVYDFQKFPSMKWKLINSQKYKKENTENYRMQLSRLEQFLSH